MARTESLERNQTDSELTPGSVDEGEGATELRTVPAEIRDVSFPVSLRGYDRAAVDAYVARVNRLIAELDVSGSPGAAVRHALEQVGEQTRDLLQRAGETAEEITLGARREAEESTARANADAGEIVAKAKAEAETIVVQAREEAAERLQRSQDEVAAVQEEAEARMREVHADTESIRQRRRALLEDLRGIAAQAAETASEAEARFQPGELAALPEEETLDLEADAEGGGSGVETSDEPHDGEAGGQTRPGR